MKSSGYAIAGFCLIALLVAALFLTAQSLQDEPKEETGLRIVSLNPNVTEILFALDVGDRIVGATTFCDYPPEAKNIPRVGGMGKPNIETILTLRPDLIIASNIHAYDATRKLQESGITLLQFKMERFEDIFAAIEGIATKTDAEARAAELTANMRNTLATVAQSYRDTPEAERPRVFFEIWQDPLGTIGGSSFVNDVIERAGGVNVARDLEDPYPRISSEAVVGWNPDVIILGYMSESGLTAKHIAQRIGWSEIKAVKSGRIVTSIPADLLLRPGPRLVDGIAMLSDILYPIQQIDEQNKKRPE